MEGESDCGEINLKWCKIIWTMVFGNMVVMELLKMITGSSISAKISNCRLILEGLLFLSFRWVGGQF